MAKPIKFAHVVYMTRRYDEMIAWYEGVFEATAVHRNPAMAFLTYDDEHHRFAFANLDLLRPGANPVGTSFDPEALLKAYRGGASNDALLRRPEGPPTDIPMGHGLA